MPEGLCLVEVLRVRPVRRGFLVRFRVLRPKGFEAECEGAVLNARRRRDAVVFSNLLRKAKERGEGGRGGPVLAVFLRRGARRLLLGKPMFLMSVEEWDDLEALASSAERVLGEYCAQNGFRLYPSRRYNRREFRAWYVRTVWGRIRVGCPFFVKGRAFWVTAERWEGDRWVDVTEKTRVRVRAWVGYAPAHRAYHGSGNVLKKLLEVVEYYREKVDGRAPALP
jgi:hypothetical protein